MNAQVDVRVVGIRTCLWRGLLIVGLMHLDYMYFFPHFFSKKMGFSFFFNNKTKIIQNLGEIILK